MSITQIEAIKALIENKAIKFTDSENNVIIYQNTEDNDIICLTGYDLDNDSVDSNVIYDNKKWVMDELETYIFTQLILIGYGNEGYEIINPLPLVNENLSSISILKALLDNKVILFEEVYGLSENPLDYIIFLEDGNIKVYSRFPEEKWKEEDDTFILQDAYDNATSIKLVNSEIKQHLN